MHRQKHQNKVSNLSKVNKKETRIMSIDVSLPVFNGKIRQILDVFYCFYH